MTFVNRHASCVKYTVLRVAPQRGLNALPSHAFYTHKKKQLVRNYFMPAGKGSAKPAGKRSVKSRFYEPSCGKTGTSVKLNHDPRTPFLNLSALSTIG